MQMNKPKTNNANNFSNQDEMRMAKSSIYMMGKNSGVVVEGTDKSGEGKLNIEDFNKQSAEIKKNIAAASSAFGKSITSDSLNQVIQYGKPSETDFLKYEKGRDMQYNIPRYYGNSFKTLDFLKEHDQAFRASSGIYSPKELKKN